VTLSVFGTIGIYTVSAPRIYFAMARDGIFFKQLAHLHPVYKTPVRAMVLQSAIAIFLILAFAKLYALMAFVTFMDIVFMTLAAISIFIFRKTKSDQEREVKAIGYPIIPLLYIIPSATFVVVTFLQVKGPTWWAMGIVLLGVPVYYLFKRTKN